MTTVRAKGSGTQSKHSVVSVPVISVPGPLHFDRDLLFFSLGALEPLLLKSIPAFSRKVVAKGKSPFCPALNIFCLLSGRES